MEEDLLQRVIQEIKTYGDLDGIEDIRPLGKALENLIARNKELETINKMQEYRISVINERELIPKSKIREIIQKYYDEYEKEKEYRYTGDVEEEQSILREIEKELLHEGR